MSVVFGRLIIIIIITGAAKTTMLILLPPFLGQLFDRVSVIKLSVRPCICTSIRQKSFFDFNEIWHVGLGQ